MTVIDTPAGIERFRVISLIQALRLETRGMKMSRGVSVLKIAQSDYGVTARTKAGALEQMISYYEDTYGEEYDGPR